MADREIRERRWPQVLPGFGQAGQTVGPFIETGNRKGSSVKGKEMMSSV